MDADLTLPQRWLTDRNLELLIRSHHLQTSRPQSHGSSKWRIERGRRGHRTEQDGL